MATDRAASIRQKLRNLAREREEDFDYVLRQYVMQRLLYRLSISEYSKQFLLKGALLFWVWNEEISLQRFNNLLNQSINQYLKIGRLLCGGTLMFFVGRLNNKQQFYESAYVKIGANKKKVRSLYFQPHQGRHPVQHQDIELYCLNCCARVITAGNNCMARMFFVFW